MAGKIPRILIVGGGTFIGNNIAAALLSQGVEVTLLVQAGSEENLERLAELTTWHTADFWDAASLRGRARGHDLVIHAVGSLKADLSRGLSHDRLNFISLRNAATMCVSDGVQEILLISGVRAPWVSRRYIQSKRQAETYLKRVGIKGTVIRSPIAYLPGSRRPMLFVILSALGRVPPFSWFWLGRIAPLSVDVVAHGVAQIALQPSRDRAIYYPRDLRRFARQRETRQVNPPERQRDMQSSEPIEIGEQAE